MSEMQVVLARLQKVLDRMPRTPVVMSPEARAAMLTEFAEWAPLRAAATTLLLAEEADVD